jgi:hypothetical protein
MEQTTVIELNLSTELFSSISAYLYYHIFSKLDRSFYDTPLCTMQVHYLELRPKMPRGHHCQHGNDFPQGKSHFAQVPILERNKNVVKYLYSYNIGGTSSGPNLISPLDLRFEGHIPSFFVEARLTAWQTWICFEVIHADTAKTLAQFSGGKSRHNLT